jgi:riboflavin synthase
MPARMFTGLVQDVGTVERVATGATTDLWIRTSLAAEAFAQGESIAVDGVCLTVVESAPERFRVQAAPETLRRSTLGELRAGFRVNLERALRLTDRIGGHLVQGHVDAVGTVVDRRAEGGSLVMAFSLPEGLRPFFVEKGSVAVDGISLTVMALSTDTFSVMLIPETQERTTLAHKTIGARVNLEADLIGKYVARLHALGRGAGSGVTLDLLGASGFARSKE